MQSITQLQDRAATFGDPQSGLAEPNQGEPNRTEPNIGRTEQRSGSFPGEHEPRRTVTPNVRFAWMFGSPEFEPNRTGVSNVRVRFVFGSFDFGTASPLWRSYNRI